MPALLIGQDLRIRAANAPARTMLDLSGTGGHIAMALRQPGVLSAVEACLATGTAQTLRYRGDEAGQEASHEAHAAPAPGGVLLTLQDVSAAVQTDLMRRDFVANVSHELRTPLTALTGFIETLAGPARGDLAATDRFLAIMAGEAARMERLVQDLLSLSRVEAQQRLRPRGTADLAQAVRDAIAALGGPTIETDLPVEPVTIQGDADQLRQLAANLVENAIKYGGERVEVSVTRAPHHAGLRGPAAILEVRDFGPGIDPIHIPRLTERFYRVDAHRSRQKGGTGLGLAIVKHIAQRHRGVLDVTSARGQGACFAVALPLADG